MRHYDPGYVSIPEADTLIQSINSTIIDSNAISIAEDDASGMGFDGEWAHGFGGTLINEIVKTTDASRDMNALSSAMTGSGFFRVLFAETHDLVGDLNGAGNQRLPKRIDSANPGSYAARKRSMLAAAAMLTSPGIPMLFMGQEMLEDAQFSSSYPLDWTHATTYSAVTNFFRDMIRLRRNLDGVSAGLTGPNMTWHVTRNDAPWKLLAFHRHGATANDQVMVVMNFTSNSIPEYIINTWPASGAWYVNLNSDWTKYGSDFSNYGSSVVNVTGSSGAISIGSYSVLILSRQALPNLDSDGDGLLNGWEQTYFGNALSGIATADNDGDGANNLHEQAADTAPVSAVSALRFIKIQRTGANVSLQWTGGQSVKQLLQHATFLSGPWTSIFTNNPPTAITNSLTVSNVVSSPRYYRIQIAP
jgi:1,4-alpha-glucan branching enzyme